jgi:hypothetical protein
MGHGQGRFTKNIASCDFFLAGIRPLVLRSASCRAVSLSDAIEEGLPVPREPAYADKRSKDCEAKSASE